MVHINFLSYNLEQSTLYSDSVSFVSLSNALTQCLQRKMSYMFSANHYSPV